MKLHREVTRDGVVVFEETYDGPDPSPEFTDTERLDNLVAALRSSPFPELRLLADAVTASRPPKDDDAGPR